MIAKMAKVQIVGPKALQLLTLQTIYRYGKVQLASATVSDYPASVQVQIKGLSAEEQEEKTSLDDALGHIDRFLNLLTDFPGVWDPKLKSQIEPISEPVENGQLSALMGKLGGIEERLAEYNRARMDLRDELALIQRYENILWTFMPLMERLKDVRQLEVIGFTVRKKQSVVVDLLRKQLEKETGGEFEIFQRELDPATLAGLISFPKKVRPVIQDIFLGSGISEVKLPAKFGDRPLPDVLADLMARLTALPIEIEKVEAAITEIVKDVNPWQLRAFRQAVGKRLATLSAIPHVGATERVFVLLGWVPERDLDEFLKLTAGELPSEVTAFRIPVTEEDMEHDRVPIRLANPKIVRPFELCLRLVPLPRYGTVDPTPFIALFFPTFFGLILGDVGYGLILSAIAFFLVKKYKEKPIVHDAGMILLICGLFTTLFGVLFGEFLGNLGIKMGIMKPILLNREEALIPLLFLAVGVGVTHVMLGITLKLVSAIRHRQRKHIGEAAGTILTLIALMVMIACITEALPKSFFTPSVVVLLIGLPILLISGGVIGILEIFGIIGNMLSYARIMAIGLSSVILAVVANEIGGAFGNILVGVLLASLIHLINFILGIFGPTIHSLRLHYVEFFGKFYVPGKTSYKPFTTGEPDTKEVGHEV